MSELRNKTVKAIGWSTSSTVLNQGFGVITAVILTRILDPSDFGIIMMVVVFTGFANIIKDFGFGGALIQKKEIDEGHKSSVFWVNVCIGAAFTIIFILIAPLIANFYDDYRLIFVTQILAVNFIISSSSVVHFSLVKRKINFKTISKIQILSSVSGGVFAIVLAILGYKYWALVVQTIVLNVLRAACFWYVSGWRPKFLFSITHIKELSAFGVNVTLVRILNYVGNRLDILLMGKILGSEALGFYNRSKKFQGLPFTAIKDQISSVLFPTLSQLQDDKPKQVDIYLKLTGLLSIMIFPIMTGLFATAEEFVIVVLTMKWQTIIPLVKIFSIAFLFAAIGYPNVVFISNDKTRELLKISTILRGVRVACVLFGVYQGTLLMITVAVAFAMIIEQIVLNYYAAKIMNASIVKILRSVTVIFIASWLMALVVIGSDYLFMENLTYMQRLILKVFFGVAFYSGFLMLFKPNPLPFIFEHYWPPKMKDLKNFLK